MALRLRGATSGYIELKSPASAGDNTLTLPTNNGSANQLLKTDGSGNLSWTDDNSGVSLSGSTNNTIATVTGANALIGEANLTFDGTILEISNPTPKLKLTDSDATGTPEAMVDGSGGDLILHVDKDNEKGSSLFAVQIDGSEKFRIASDGKTGIGVTPSRHLDIKDSSGANRIVNIRGTGTSGAFLAFLDANTTDDSYARVGTKGGNAISLRGNEHYFERGYDGAFRMIIDSSGKLGIGESSPATLLHLKGNDTAYGGVGNSTTASGAKIRVQDTAGRIVEIVSPGTAAEAGIGSITNHNFTLFTSNTERARFMSGNLSDPAFCVGTTSNTVNSANFGHAIFYDGAVGHFRDIDGSNLTFRAGGNQGLLTIAGDGDALNTNNSYGQASDERLKQDIVDAASQWDDIKGLRVRKFRFKDNPSGVLQIGVIAQEIETVSAGLVKTNSEGIKSVKYSVLYMKTVKCLQEAIAKIETLETKVAALESA